MGFESVFDSQVSKASRERNFAPTLPPDVQDKMDRALQGLSILKSGVSPRDQDNLPTMLDQNDEKDQSHLVDYLRDLNPD